MSSVAYADGSAMEGTRIHAGQFQPEIQGLRAISVLAVIWTHAGLPGLPGGFTGVDVFFVISGFLITRLLLTEIARNDQIDLLAFWSRRARRLLPNACAALIGTLLLALLLFPGYNPQRLASEITYAALEVANFHFAGKAIDYFQTDSPASPVLHFWSLSVEEQFYLCWPLLLAGICLLGRRNRSGRIVLALGLIWCASFAASLVLTPISQPIAYFGTGTRCWQLATGALLAAGWPQIERLPSAMRCAIAWLGVGAILFGLVMIDDGAFYPGAWALLPALGAGALMAGFGATEPAGLLRRSLSAPVMQWIGARSYSWYLWHWPLLALPRATFPDTPYIAEIAIPVSLAIACLAYHWIETPLRQSRVLAAAPLATLAGAAAMLGLVISAGYAYPPALFLVDARLAARAAQIDAASRDLSQASREGCFLNQVRSDQPPCVYGDTAGRRRVVLFGHSHADHWFAPLNAAAKQAGWQLLSWTKTNCSCASISQHLGGRYYLACDQWREEVLGRMTQTEIPDLVVLSDRIYYAKKDFYDPATGRYLSAEEGEVAWREGFRKTIGRLIAAGARVLVIGDIPRADKDYQACLLTGKICATPRTRALAFPPADAEVAREFGDHVTFADFNDRICDRTSCPAIRDGVIVYRDNSHLTATYAASFAPQLTELLRRFAASPAIQPDEKTIRATAEVRHAQ
jgi:peptidoglycan/LPS O-acetylase OafA/YrhL